MAFGCDLDFLIVIRWQESLKIINWCKIAAVNSAYYPICDLVISKTRWKCRVHSQRAFCTPGPEYIEQSLATGLWKFTWTSARSFVSMGWSYHVFQDSHGTHCEFASPKRWPSYIKTQKDSNLPWGKSFIDSQFLVSPLWILWSSFWNQLLEGLFFTASQVQLSRRASAKVPPHRSANWVVELPMNEYHTTTHHPVNHSGMKLGMVGLLVDYYMIWMYIFLEFLVWGTWKEIKILDACETSTPPTSTPRGEANWRWLLPEQHHGDGSFITFERNLFKVSWVKKMPNSRLEACNNLIETASDCLTTAGYESTTKKTTNNLRDRISFVYCIFIFMTFISKLRIFSSTEIQLF